MSVAFYFDHNVRAAVTSGLRQRGVDVLTVYEDGRAEEDDSVLLQRAAELGRVSFTHDDDFLAVGNQWLSQGRTFAGIIYVHQLRLTIGETIAELEIVAKAGDPEDFVGQITYLPL